MAKKKISKKTQRQLEQIAKTNIVGIVCVAIFALVGVLCGIFGYRYITKNDKFEVVGDKEVVLNIGDTYTEKGASIVAFGKDLSSDAVITGEVDTTQEGIYYITYTVNNFKYKDVKRVRTVVVTTEEV